MHVSPNECRKNARHKMHVIAFFDSGEVNAKRVSVYIRLNLPAQSGYREYKLVRSCPSST